MKKTLHIPNINLSFVLFFLFFTASLAAQKMPKTVSAKPVVFERPLDVVGFDETELGTGKKDRLDAPWIVICDRSEKELTLTYESESASSPPFRMLTFKDWYYVIGETDQWLRLAKAQLKGRKIVGEADDFGWIEKKNVLLWSYGLLHPKTQINKKAFLLNKKEEIEKILDSDNPNIAKIFKGPKSGQTIGEKNIYEFYFIMKKEGNRYLISKEVELTPGYNLSDALVGWIGQEQVEDWNTRICMEPNFTPSAFEERKANENFRVKAFFDENSAKTHAEEGIVDRKNVEWENDPVVLNIDQLATTDSKRFKGGVVRFPMLGNNENYFRTGLIGEILAKDIYKELETIGEINYSGIVKELKNGETTRTNYNVFFLIEGTANMSSFKPAIIKTIESVQKELAGVNSLKIGAAIYRGTPEKQIDKLFDLTPLSSEVEKITDFVTTTPFNKNQQDNNNYTVLNYGLFRSLLEAGFNDKQTNIIYVIGNYSDFSADSDRKIEAEKEKKETLVSSNDIADKMEELNVHLVSIQCRNDDGKSSSMFIDQSQELMLEAAKKQFNMYKGVTTYIENLTQLKNPSLPDFDENNTLRMRGSSSQGMIIKAPVQGTLTEKQVIDFGTKTAADIRVFTNEFWDAMNKIIIEGARFDEVSAGPLTNAAVKKMFDLLKKKEGWVEEDLEKLTKSNYKLYTEVFLPKTVKGAKNPALSYVLFMPEKDLEHYILALDRVAYASTKSTNELREALFNALISLLQNYTGNKSINELAQLTTEDLRVIMQGIDKEGLQISQNQDFVIENILKKKEISDEEVRSIAQSFMDKAKTLKKIYKESKHYEFSYNSGGLTYFWIPIDITL